MRKILGQKFFRRDADIVARELLGKFLVRKAGKRETASMITETEAYLGAHDLASHASKGETGRTKVMFGRPGAFYVYLIYGMHLLLNIVVREKGYPAAVLIRGLASAEGPGRAAKFLKVGKNLNGKPASKKTGLWVEDRGMRIPERLVRKTPRIGVEYAGPVWSKKKLRFVLKKA